jgi:hypothetical protein
MMFDFSRRVEVKSFEWRVQSGKSGTIFGRAASGQVRRRPRHSVVATKDQKRRGQTGANGGNGENGLGLAASSYHLTGWKWLEMKDVTGCCRFVADLLPIKWLIINDVTDVTGFKSIISMSEWVNQ